MSPKFQILLVIMLVITLAVYISKLRMKKLQLQYSLNWLIMLVILTIVAIFPGLLQTVSKWVGIELPINFIFFLGFCFVLVIVFGLTITVSKLSGENKLLAQRIALLEKQNEEGKQDENRN